MITNPLVSLTHEDIQGLTEIELVERMDGFLLQILFETYPLFNTMVASGFQRKSILEFTKTKIISGLNPQLLRKVIYKCFNMLVLMEYSDRLGGWGNNAIYNSSYDQNKSWLSPRLQTIYGASKHFNISSSYAAFEKLMDLIFLIETGNTIEGKSKFKKFYKWLLQVENKFVYLAPFLIPINEFRKKLRTAELHEWSAIPRELLCLKRPSHEESNEALKLLNLLNGLWMAVISILNKNMPTIGIGTDASVWINIFYTNDKLALQEKLNEIKLSLENQRI